MGGFISRFRKKPTTIEILERLDSEIQTLENLKQSNLERQKKIIGSLLIYSVLLYVISAIVFYFVYLPEQWSDRLMYSSPLLVFPFIVWFVKRFLHWYFVKRISGNEGQLEELKEQRGKILEEVMEKETYKKAKEILEKFDPERFKKLETPLHTPAPAKTPAGQELRQRTGKGSETPAVVAPTLSQTPGVPVPVGSVRPTLRVGGETPTHRTTQQQKIMMARSPPPPGPPMARPVLPRERTIVDKLVEYLVGDGPQNRYALICKNCQSHNGMALKEEFEYIAFRCCYCYTNNPARKQRPSAPRLPFDTPPVAKRTLTLQHKEASGSEEDSDSGSSKKQTDKKSQ